MSITFRITTDADYRESPIAEITRERLDALLSYMRERGARSGVALLDPDIDDEEDPATDLYVRVCPLAVASIAAIFDFDAAVIAVVDEAQFRQRRVHIRRPRNTGIVMMRVSIESDPGYEMDLAIGNAFALIEALGAPCESIGELSIGDLRARLPNPAVQRRCERHQVTHYLPRIERLLTLAEGDPSAVFEWV